MRPYRAYRRCKHCGRQDVWISARGRCEACGLGRMTAAAVEQNARQGAAYDLWRDRMIEHYRRKLAELEAERAAARACKS